MRGAVIRFALALALGVTQSAAAFADTIGLVLPLSGRFGPIAERIEFGALMANTSLKQSGREISIRVIDDPCDGSKADDTARTLREADARIVIGPVCFLAGRALANSLAKDATAPRFPVVMWDTRNPLLQRARNVDGLPLYALSAKPEAEAQALVEQVLPKFGDRAWALIDDGSVYGRAIAEGVRQLAERAGAQPVTTAAFRPLQTNQRALLRRLRNAGAEAVIVAASAVEDIATLASDLDALGFDWPVGVGEPARLLPLLSRSRPISANLMMVRARDLPSAPAQAVLKRLEADGVEVEDSVLIGHALVEIAAEALKDNRLVVDGRTFETVAGPLTFGTDGRADPAPFALYRWRDGGFEAESSPTQ